MSNTSNLLAIDSCKFRIARGHENNSIFCQKSDLHYETHCYVVCETFCMLCYTLVYREIQYGIIVWATADNTSLGSF